MTRHLIAGALGQQHAALSATIRAPWADFALAKQNKTYGIGAMATTMTIQATTEAGDLL